MGKVFEIIDDKLREFIESQHMFFVATAPAQNDGHINLSPKGLDAFRILGPTSVAYLDLGGSGIETVAHVKENGRIVIMFCAFEGKPKIVRLHGRGTVHEQDSARFKELVALYPKTPGTRTVIEIELTRIADSCGWGVPRMDFVEHRTQLPAFADKLGPEKLLEYAATNNAESLDGLPGLSIPATAAN